MVHYTMMKGENPLCACGAHKSGVKHSSDATRVDCEKCLKVIGAPAPIDCVEEAIRIVSKMPNIRSGQCSFNPFGITVRGDFLNASDLAMLFNEREFETKEATVEWIAKSIADMVVWMNGEECEHDEA